MSEPIKAGDVAVVIRGNACGCVPGLGRVFSVVEVEDSGLGGVQCAKCERYLGRYFGARAPDGKWYGLHRLKRIPPLKELDDVKRDEEITA